MKCTKRVNIFHIELTKKKTFLIQKLKKFQDLVVRIRNYFTYTHTYVNSIKYKF